MQTTFYSWKDCHVTFLSSSVHVTIHRHASRELTTNTHNCYSTHHLLPRTSSFFEGDSKPFGSRISEGNVVFSTGDLFVFILYKTKLSLDCLYHHIYWCTTKMISIYKPDKNTLSVCFYPTGNSTQPNVELHESVSLWDYLIQYPHLFTALNDCSFTEHNRDEPRSISESAGTTWSWSSLHRRSKTTWRGSLFGVAASWWASTSS